MGHALPCEHTQETLGLGGSGGRLSWGFRGKKWARQGKQARLNDFSRRALGCRAVPGCRDPALQRLGQVDSDSI